MKMICIKCNNEIELDNILFQLGEFPKCCGITMSSNIKKEFKARHKK